MLDTPRYGSGTEALPGFTLVARPPGEVAEWLKALAC